MLHHCHMVVSCNYRAVAMATRPDPLVEPIRDASRRLVRELGFMRDTLAGTGLPRSAVHALIEIGRNGALPSTSLCEAL